MEHSPVDRYAGKKGLLQEIPAEIKLSFTIFILVILSFPINSLPFLLSVSGIGFVLLALSKIPVIFTARRLLTVSPFILFVLIMNPKQPLSFFMRVFNSVFFVFLFVSTTPFPDFFKLFEKLKVPTPFLIVISMGYRFFFLIKEEIEKMLRAWKVRGGEMEFLRIKNIAFLINSTIERTMKRAGKLSIVLKVRGYDAGS